MSRKKEKAMYCLHQNGFPEAVCVGENLEYIREQAYMMVQEGEATPGELLLCQLIPLEIAADLTESLQWKRVRSRAEAHKELKNAKRRYAKKHAE
jgi:hypothetical protein